MYQLLAIFRLLGGPLLDELFDLALPKPDGLGLVDFVVVLDEQHVILEQLANGLIRAPAGSRILLPRPSFRSPAPNC